MKPWASLAIASHILVQINLPMPLEEEWRLISLHCWEEGEPDQARLREALVAA
jgi:hypothetical protein